MIKGGKEIGASQKADYVMEMTGDSQLRPCIVNDESFMDDTFAENTYHPELEMAMGNLSTIAREMR